MTHYTKISKKKWKYSYLLEPDIAIYIYRLFSYPSSFRYSRYINLHGNTPDYFLLFFLSPNPQVFHSLLKAHAVEARAVVKQALEILTPAMPGRMEDGNVGQGHE